MTTLESILGEIAGLTPMGALLMALAGLVVGVAPSSYPLLAVAAGFSAGGQAAMAERSRYRGAYLAGGFVLGVALVDAALGALFGLFGFAVLRVLSPFMPHTYFVLSAILLFLGLVMLRVVRIKIRFLYASPRAANSFGAALLLGIPFGLSTCPACTPLLLPVLMTAAGSGDAAMGALLLFVFGLARGVPILLVGAAAGVLTRLGGAMLWIPRVERAAGVLLLLAAVMFAYQAAVYARWLPRLGSLEMRTEVVDAISDCGGSRAEDLRRLAARTSTVVGAQPTAGDAVGRIRVAEAPSYRRFALVS